MRSSRLRLGVAIALLLSGGLAAGILAWREAERAHSTAEVLMKDYASFIAERFVRLSAIRLLALVGMSDSSPTGNSPIGTLRTYAQRERGGQETGLPAPDGCVIDYFFRFDSRTRGLEFSGSAPPDSERTELLRAISHIDLKCSPNELFAFSRVPGGPTRQETAGWYPWSVVLQTDANGAIQRIYGLRLNDEQLIKSVFLPLMGSQDECAAETHLLPASLVHIKDPRQAASFVLRDAFGRVVCATDPRYQNQSLVRQALSMEMPFSGWTVEIAVNPAAIQPLLPYRGRGTSWPALSLVGLLILGSAILALRSLQTEVRFSRLQQGFVASVSHYLKSPLARIRLFNELLMGNGQPDQTKRAHYRRVIERECRRLTFLIENILDFSRLEGGSGGLERSVVNLRKTVEEALDIFRLASDLERYSLVVDLAEVGSVSGNPQALQQVLINLLDNAVKYSPEGSTITVRLNSENHSARLMVTDQGSGIPKLEREKIFKAFYRVPANSNEHDRQTSGSGLGLTLVQKTVQAHGGTVTVESEPKTGSTFTVTLPLVSE